MYLSETTNELYRIFSLLNDKFFEGELEEPIITIQKTHPNTSGWYELKPLWIKNGDTEVCKHEINLSSRIFQIIDEDDSVDLVACLLHEMVHFYDDTILHVKDCSGRVHNKKFAESARKVGLEVEQDKSVGFGYTQPGEELKKYIKEEVKPNSNALTYYHREEEKEKKEKKPKTKYIFTCPSCGKQFNLKDRYNIMCGDCKVQFEVEVEEN